MLAGSAVHVDIVCRHFCYGLYEDWDKAAETRIVVLLYSISPHDLFQTPRSVCSESALSTIWSTVLVIYSFYHHVLICDGNLNLSALRQIFVTRAAIMMPDVLHSGGCFEAGV